MRWIGQHIWNFISRFRTTVYLENLETSSDENVLVVNSDGKVTKNTTLGGADLTYNGNTASGVLTYGSASTIDVEPTFTYSGASGMCNLSNTLGGSLPVITLTNSNAGPAGPNIRFEKTADGEDDDVLGFLSFAGDDDGGTSTTYVTIQAEIADASDTDEAGRLELKVRSDGSNMYNGLTATGLGTGARVDVEIADGTTSTTTIAGDLTVTSQASMPQRLFAIPSDGAGNVDGDIVYIGTNTGGTATVAGKIYYYADTGLWVLTNSDDPGTATGWLAVALGTDPDADGMLVRGMVDLAGNIVGTEALGSIIYLDKATAGDATTAAPTVTGDIVRVIGYAVSTGDTNKIWFNPDNTWVEHV